MKLLDLFCGAGGCSAGYAAAGFEVTGVDTARTAGFVKSLGEMPPRQRSGRRWG